MPDHSGFLWLTIDLLFVSIFAIALIYAIARWRTARRTGSDRRADAATTRMYHQSEEQADREAAQRSGYP